MPWTNHTQSTSDGAHSSRFDKMSRLLFLTGLLTFLVLACANPLARLRRGGPRGPGPWVKPPADENSAEALEALNQAITALNFTLVRIHQAFADEVEENKPEELLEKQISSVKAAIKEAEDALVGTIDEQTRRDLEKYKRDLEGLLKELELQLEQKIRDLEEDRRKLADKNKERHAHLSEEWHELRAMSKELEKEMMELLKTKAQLEKKNYSK